MNSYIFLYKFVVQMKFAPGDTSSAYTKSQYHISKRTPQNSPSLDRAKSPPALNPQELFECLYASQDLDCSQNGASPGSVVWEGPEYIEERVLGYDGDFVEDGVGTDHCDGEVWRRREV